MGRPGVTQTKPCEHCGTAVTKTGKQQSQRTYWTCGVACATALRMAKNATVLDWQENRFRGRRESRPCAICGKDTAVRYVTEANHDKPWYCSLPCRGAGRTGKTYQQLKGDTVPCAICGKDFYRLPKEIARDRQYCSIACKSIAHRAEVVIRPCAQCGKEMPLRPSDLEQVFCSWACNVEAKFTRALDRMHNGKPARLVDDGYVKVWEPEHPNATRGWVLEHRLIMEKHLGRLLTSAEEVDHKNTDRSDNALENLQVLSKGAHRRKTGADNRAKRQTMRDKLAEYERRYGPLDPQ